MMLCILPHWPVQCTVQMDVIILTGFQLLSTQSLPENSIPNHLKLFLGALLPQQGDQSEEMMSSTWWDNCSLMSF